jgi:hypothetical protein
MKDLGLRRSRRAPAVATPPTFRAVGPTCWTGAGMADEHDKVTPQGESAVEIFRDRIAKAREDLKAITIHEVPGALWDTAKWDVSKFDLSLSRPLTKTREIFVAYSYRLFPSDDYRTPFKELQSAFDVRFVFADERIDSLHILERIRDMIRSSAFGIYDISGWNPNVTLEIGLALGIPKPAYLLLNPDKKESGGEAVPADLAGLGRLQWTSYAQLREHLKKILSTEYPFPVNDVTDRLSALQDKVYHFLRTLPEGMSVLKLADNFGVKSPLMKLAVQGLIDQGRIKKGSGNKRSTKYVVAG